MEGWDAELRDGSRSIVIRGGPANQYDPARSEAVSKAQQALDWLSAHRVVDLGIHHADDDQLVWWTEQNRVVLRMTCVETQRAGRFASPAADESEPLSRLTGEPIDWDPSYRYFRLSQTTDDTFDAFRNLYLALESLLDTIRPMQQPSAGKRESEIAWLKAALATVANKVDLEPYTLPGNGKAESKIYNEIYEARRNPVFHAKPSRRPLLPGEHRDRTDLAASARRLTGLYLALAHAYLGLRPSEGGGIFDITFHKMVLEDTDLRIHLSDLTERLTWEEVVARGLEDRIVMVETKSARQLEKKRARALFVPFMASFLAQASAKSVSQLSGVTQIWTSEGDENPIPRFVLDGSGLTLGGIDRLEVHLGLRLTQPVWGRDVYVR
jgi:hypothetical protein